MADRTTEALDVALIRASLFSPCALELEEIPRRPGLEKTPDFRIISPTGFAGFCELKSPRDDRLDDELERAEPGQIVRAGGNDSTYSRLARHIKNAVAQFDVVNANREHPNVLVFVDHADYADLGDLMATLRGYVDADDGQKYALSPRISRALAEIKYLIDLYIWVDRAEKRGKGWLFSRSNAAHNEKLMLLFESVRPPR